MRGSKDARDRKTILPKHGALNSPWSSKATKACGRGCGVELSTLKLNRALSALQQPTGLAYTTDNVRIDPDWIERSTHLGSAW
jgi:hypothetical protein